ncbi:DUF397 domain-containing protein [Actinomadura sp. LD22]|uniref:DUF397 domain-containing protein n=1 Tax=Actinomadura physcomitrii TaxID=2650748 RepID=A0A6I4MKY7_9ACTN|nr:DUF397 domain-containing protein [Actinomadura physcomitrii]MWA05580.1 DUF397 domain-containing protein [Actinomadura physcomitrii]
MTPLAWRKSNRSTNQGGECVEVAAFSDCIRMRDSKDPHGGHLALAPAQFAALVRRLKDAH